MADDDGVRGDQDTEPVPRTPRRDLPSLAFRSGVGKRLQSVREGTSPVDKVTVPTMNAAHSPATVEDTYIRRGQQHRGAARHAVDRLRRQVSVRVCVLVPAR